MSCNEIDIFMHCHGLLGIMGKQSRHHLSLACPIIAAITFPRRPAVCPPTCLSLGGTCTCSREGRSQCVHSPLACWGSGCRQDSHSPSHSSQVGHVAVDVGAIALPPFTGTWLQWAWPVRERLLAGLVPLPLLLLKGHARHASPPAMAWLGKGQGRPSSPLTDLTAMRVFPNKNNYLMLFLWFEKLLLCKWYILLYLNKPFIVGSPWFMTGCTMTIWSYEELPQSYFWLILGVMVTAYPYLWLMTERQCPGIHSMTSVFA